MLHRLFLLFVHLCQRAARRRGPDVVIGGWESPYLYRWFLIPRNRFFNVYLHCFLRSDDDRAHHDHPWLFNASLLLDGEYIEHTIATGGIAKTTRRGPGALKVRFGAAPHRIELLEQFAVEVRPARANAIDEPLRCWTLFITGPRCREWGFHCVHRWIHWKEFTAADDPGAIGKGCDA